METKTVGAVATPTPSQDDNIALRDLVGQDIRIPIDEAGNTVTPQTLIDRLSSALAEGGAKQAKAEELMAAIGVSQDRGEFYIARVVVAAMQMPLIGF